MGSRGARGPGNRSRHLPLPRKRLRWRGKLQVTQAGRYSPARTAPGEAEMGSKRAVRAQPRPITVPPPHSNFTEPSLNVPMPGTAWHIMVPGWLNDTMVSTKKESHHSCISKNKEHESRLTFGACFSRRSPPGPAKPACHARSSSPPGQGAPGLPTPCRGRSPRCVGLGVKEPQVIANTLSCEFWEAPRRLLLLHTSQQGSPVRRSDLVSLKITGMQKEL